MVITKTIDDLNIGTIVICEDMFGRDYLYVIEDLYWTPILTTIGKADDPKYSYQLSRVTYRKVGVDRFIWYYGSVYRDKCECGAHKTYGISCSAIYHAFYCPLYNKRS